MLPLLLTLVALASPTASDYRRHLLHELVARADRVVVGTVTDVQERTYDLEVQEVLYGTASGTLRLQRFFDWTCAGRWAPYERGQRVVLFLMGDRALGAGNEGDWPLVPAADGSGLVAHAPYSIQGSERISLDLGRTYEESGTPVDLSPLGAAIRGFREVFRLDPVEPRGLWEVRFARDRAAAEAYSRSSPLARHLFEEATSAHRFVPDEVASRPPLDAPPLVRVCADGYGPAERSQYAGVDSQLGRVVAAAGDVNGDGQEDLVLLGDDQSLWVLLPDPSGKVFSLRAHDIRPLVVEPFRWVRSLAVLDRAGPEGSADVLLSVGTLDQPARLWRMSLGDESGLQEPRELVPDVPLEKESAIAAVSLGDLDADGWQELLLPASTKYDLGALLAELGGEPREPPTWPLLHLSPTSECRTQPLPVANLGGADLRWVGADGLVALGDLDGDGLTELAIGSTLDSDGGDFRGAVWLVFPNRDGTIRTRAKLSDWSGGETGSFRDADRFGRIVAAPGDLDGDGVPDLVVGGENELWVLFLTREGSSRRVRQYGLRSGGLPPFQKLRSIAVLRAPGGARRLALMAERAGKPLREAVVYLLELDPDGALRTIRDS